MTYTDNCPKLKIAVPDTISYYIEIYRLKTCGTLELPRTLREVDVPEEGLAVIAAATLHDRSLSTNPKPITDAGPIMDVLRAAY